MARSLVVGLATLFASGCAHSDAAEGLARAAPRPTVVLEAQRTEASVKIDGKLHALVRTTCAKGERKDASARHLREIARAAERHRPGGVVVRLAEDLSTAQSDAVLGEVSGGDITPVPAAPARACGGSLGGLQVSTSTRAAAGVPKETSAEPPRGSLSKEEIGGVFRAALHRFKWCYEVVLERDPNAEGSVVTHFTIDAAGRVARSAVLTNTVDVAMTECMIERLKRLEFPKPRRGGIVVVTYPFAFATK